MNEINVDGCEVGDYFVMDGHGSNFSFTPQGEPLRVYTENQIKEDIGMSFDDLLEIKDQLKELFPERFV